MTKKGAYKNWVLVSLQIVNLMLWGVSTAVALAVVYGPFQLENQSRIIPAVDAVFYDGFARTAWSLALGYVILACCTGHGGKFVIMCRMGYFIPVIELNIFPWQIKCIYYGSRKDNSQCCIDYGRTIATLQKNTLSTLLSYFGSRSYTMATARVGKLLLTLTMAVVFAEILVGIFIYLYIHFIIKVLLPNY